MRPIWLFVALFLLFGVAAWLSEDAWRQFWAGLSVISLGTFALAMVHEGVTSGHLRMQYVPLKRAEQPRAFWGAVAVIAAAGLVTIAGGLWMLFWKV